LKSIKLKSNILNLLLASVGVLIILFLFIKLKSFVGKIDFRELSFNYYYLALSFSLIPVWFSIMCYIWKDLLREMGYRISQIDAMRIIGLSMFGKYIPGKLWFTLGRAVLAERLGVPKKLTFTTIILETYFLLLTGAGFFVFLLFSLPTKPSYYTSLFVVALILLFPLSLPSVFKRILNFLLKLLKKDSLEINLSIFYVVKIMFLYIIVWVISGIEFYLLFRSFSSLPLDPMIGISIYPAAWIIGFVVIIMPAGLGFREGVMFFFLSQKVPSETAVVMTLLSRIQITIGELFYLFLLFGSKKLWRSNEKEN